MQATCENIEKLEANKTPIIDIRLESEWLATGIIKESYPITFFDEKGGYDAEVFLQDVKKILNNNQSIAIICRTASRTGMIAPFLQEHLEIDVIDLQGGIMGLTRDGYKTTPYKG